MTLLLLTLLAAEPLPLSLAKAVELAEVPNGNLRLEIARETTAQAEARRRVALGAFLPQVDGTAGASNQTRNLAAFGFQAQPGLPFALPGFVGPFTVVDYRVSAVQSLLDLSAIERYRAAKLQKAATAASVRLAREQTAQMVARAYVAALRAEAAVTAARANVALAERLEALAETQRRAGTGTRIELTRSQVQRQNERQRLLVAENEAKKAHLELKRVTGVDWEQELVLTDRLNDGSEEVPVVAAALAAAWSERADLAAQGYRQQAALTQQKSIAAERWPSIAASGDYGTIGNGTQLLPTRTVGVSLRLPVFDGGRREARLGEAGSVVRQERLREQDLRRQIELEVREALVSLENAKGQIAVAREGLGLAEAELEQAQRRLTAGVGSSVELTDAQTRLARARDNQLSAVALFNLARIELAAATGQMDMAVRGLSK